MSFHFSRVFPSNTGKSELYRMVLSSLREIRVLKVNIYSWWWILRIPEQYRILVIVCIHSFLRQHLEYNIEGSVLHLQRCWARSDLYRQVIGFHECRFLILQILWRVIFHQNMNDSWSLASMESQIMLSQIRVKNMSPSFLRLSVSRTEIRKQLSSSIRIIIAMLHMRNMQAR